MILEILHAANSFCSESVRIPVTTGAQIEARVLCAGRLTTGIPIPGIRSLRQVIGADREGPAQNARDGLDVRGGDDGHTALVSDLTGLARDAAHCNCLMVGGSL
jgi:hypothetical protein